MQLLNATREQMVTFPNNRKDLPSAKELDRVVKYLGWGDEIGSVLLSGGWHIFDADSKTWKPGEGLPGVETKPSDWKVFRFNQIPFVDEITHLDQESGENFEQRHVIDVYNEVAKSFDKTRFKEWGRVGDFIRSIPSGSTMADIGCGNGRHMKLRDDIFVTGCDASRAMVDLCLERGFDCGCR